MSSGAEKSEVWLYFDKLNAEFAKCKKCGNDINCKGGSTSGLKRHLFSKHTIVIQTNHSADCKSSTSAAKRKKNTAKSGASSSQPILKFMKRQSLQEIVSRLVTLDGFSVHGVTKSAFIRESLDSRGYHLPKDKTNVMKLVHTFCGTAKEQVKEEIIKLKKVKFAATLDEWTSIKNRRYLNINIHSTDGKFFNLGLIRIKQNCSAETIEALMLNKLGEFGLTFADIVAATTDGAAVMIKFGRLISITSFHIECLNHALHLAVIDVFFKILSVYNSNESDRSNADDTDSLSSDGDEDDDSDDITDEEPIRYEIRADINDILQKVRKIVKTFKKSPVKNAVLQDRIKEKHGKELMLILDCRTRWNSTEQMINRFVLLSESIVLALNELNLSELIIGDEDINMLRNLLKCLQPIKLVSEEFGRRGANLLTAEAAISFLFETLEQQKDYICIISLVL